MLATVICSKCGDAVDVTSRSVVLPFTCESCEEAIGKFASNVEEEETKQKYEDMAPSNVPCTAGLLEPGSEMSEPDGATVENTTLLIEDLEKQVVDAKQLAADRLKEIEACDRIVQSYRKLANDADVQLVSAEARNENQYNTIVRLERQCDQMATRLILAKGLIVSLEQSVTAARAEMTDAREQAEQDQNLANYWKQEYRDTAHRLRQERSKSLWTRIKEYLLD
jgi:endogenous inhibitor of DNA gyrase (YacG/DUF329 family)